MKKYLLFSLVICMAVLMLTSRAETQGPQTSYFFHPMTELPWASCFLYHSGGSRQKIPFLPVVNMNFYRAPLGIGNYLRDAVADGSLVFIGNGIVIDGEWNSYIGRRHDISIGEIDVTDKIVFFCFDAPDIYQEKFGKKFPLSKKIKEAADRKAAAVVLFSSRQDYPFLMVQYQNESEIPDIPVITISRESALNIFAASGCFDASVIDEWEKTRTPPQSMELITRMKLEIQGAFARIETDNFILSYPRGSYSDGDMKQIANLNEKSLQFLFKIFNDGEKIKWDKLFTAFFPGYDSKLFYTRHWGRGLACKEGIFNFFEGGVPDYGLIVHENMHILTRINWSSNTPSFLAEGIAMYAEALATDKQKNHLRTAEFLKEGKLFPLEEMTGFMIGVSGLKTDVGYPAGGSFTGFLIEKYGLNSFKEAYALEGRIPEEREKDDTWKRVYGKDLRSLEEEWLRWLAKGYDVKEEALRNHFDKVSKSRQIIELEPSILKDYPGVYRISSDFYLKIIREDKNLLAELPGLGKVKLYPESETVFFFKFIDWKVTFIRDEKGLVTHLVLDYFGQEMKAVKEKENIT